MRYLLLFAAVIFLLLSCGADPEAQTASDGREGAEATATAESDVREDGDGAADDTADGDATDDLAPLDIAETTPELQILADGVVRAGLPELPLSFDVSGKVLSVRVRSGDTVRAGEIIATVDDALIREQLVQSELSLRSAELSLRTIARPDDWETETEREVAAASLQSARASLESARASLSSAVASRDIAVRNLDDLSDSDEIALANLQSALASLESSQAQLESLERGPDADSIRQAELNLEQARNGLESAELDRETSLLPNTSPAVQQQLDTAVENAQISVELAEIALRRTTSGATAGELAAARASVAGAGAQVASARSSVEDVEDAIAQAEASLIQAEAGVVQAQSALSQSEANLAALLAGGSARELAAAEINVAQAELSLAQAQRDLENTVLRSPVAGAVLSVTVAPGTSVSPGSTVVTLLDTGSLEFHTTNVTERDLSDIRVGQPAAVSLKAYPAREFVGRVLRVGLQAGEPVGDSATFPVIIGFEVGELTVVPDMTGRVEIALDQ